MIRRLAQLCVLCLTLTAVAGAEESPQIIPPKPIDLPEIPFPEGATAATSIVDVQVRLTITVTGEVREVELVSGAGDPFDSAVLAGVKRFHFEPAQMNGQPAEVVVPFTHHFIIQAAPPPNGSEAGPKKDAVLSGLVQERGTRKPIADVSVLATVAGAEFLTTTDAQGHFHLEVPSGELDVRAVDSGHQPFKQHEKLQAGQELKVRYLIDRVSYNAYETVIQGRQERTEVSRTTLSGREITKVPGTFGDPFRVVTVLPGVSTVMSLLPYPVVRGSSPGNTGLLLDGVRVPLMFHLFAGPAIIHPEFIERVDFYPGGFPVMYGGYTGGIVDGLTRNPNPEPRTELDLGLTQAGVFLRRTSEKLGVTATVAGRYGYPGLILSLVSPAVSLSYWDYQARLDGPAFGGQWTVFAYGARDDLKAQTTDSTGATVLQQVILLQTHHIDLRWRTGNEEHSRSARLILSDDESKSGTSSFTSTLGITPQLRLRQVLTRSLAFDAGIDGSASRIRTTRSADAQQALSVLTDALEDNGTLLSAGVFAQLAWKPVERLMIIPGVRGDVRHDSSNTRWSADPRLMMRWRLNDADVGGTTLKAAIGIYHQPPRLALPVPGADAAKLSYELLASRQASVGAEVKLAPGIELDAQTYFNWNNPVLFDLSVNQDPSQLLNAAPTTNPGDGQLATNTRPDEAQAVVNRLFTPATGRSYGLELMLRKRDTNGFFGWIAYTLSHSERQTSSGTSPFDFDRTHILNAVGGLRLPRNWELGARILLQTGTPVTTFHGYNTGRTEPQLRVDVRVDKRAVWNNWLLDFYLDVINATVAEESGGLVGSDAFRYVLPTVGFRAVL